MTDVPLTRVFRALEAELGDELSATQLLRAASVACQTLGQPLQAESLFPAVDHGRDAGGDGPAAVPSRALQYPVMP